MKHILPAIAILFLFFASCKNADNKEMAIVEPLSKNGESQIKTATISEQDATSVAVALTKEIIKTGNLILEVNKNEDYTAYLKTLVKQYGASILKEDNNVIDNNEQTILVIKVPVARFDSLMNALVSKDVKQLQKNITSEDVTAEVIDTKARLDTRKATRDKYLEFLKQSNKIENVLKIQLEINNIQEEIESAEARLAHLSGQARYSTINLAYFEPHSGYSYNGNPGFGSRIALAFKNGAEIFVEIFIAFITAWPFWIGGILLFIIIKKLRRKRPIGGNSNS